MKQLSRLFACAVLAASTMTAPMTANAMPLPVPAAPIEKSTLNEKQPGVTDVRWRKRCNNRRCGWARHHRAHRHWGHRHRHWGHRHRHWRSGVFIAPRVVVRPRVVIRDRARLSRHDRWCMNRYRSYNPATNRFLAYSGEYKRCNSPFR